ncbi:alpha/beta fold hydrolase [Streptomyces sp. ODS28]|uniref:alpha/beta hydrolase family protein n=1 Tax=Streptomyces sp. ODS28 TaxID=3136688 RepID=UPI0031EB2FE1
MDREAECEIARATLSEVTERDDARPPREPVRRTLRTADGVPIEAEYLPYAGGGPASRGSGTGSSPGGAIVLAHGFTGSLGKPALRRAARAFTQHAAVVALSFRGHGGSGGRSTLGDREVLDLAAAVRWARELGHARVATVGFSMGGSVVLRHGGLFRNPGHAADTHESADGDSACTAARQVHEGRTGAHSVPDPQGTPVRGSAPAPHAGPGNPGNPENPYGPAYPDADPDAYPDAYPDAVVAVSAPARWFYRGTPPMRRLHWVVERRLGRAVGRYGLRTRIHHRRWNPVPLPPVAAAPLIAPAPLLVVHGDLDRYFPLDHPRSLAEAAGPRGAELWIEHGFGHAENAARPTLLHRIGSWVEARCLEAPAARHHGKRAADA